MGIRQHIKQHRLHSLSERLEELSIAVGACGQQAPPPELADDVAAIRERSCSNGLTWGATSWRARPSRTRADCVRRRTRFPSPARLIEGGALLARRVERIIRSDRRAA